MQNVLVPFILHTRSSNAPKKKKRLINSILAQIRASQSSLAG